MIILSHRGFWHRPEEKNTHKAFARAFENGFGVELDVRDCDGTLVISHDPPRKGGLTFAEVIALYRNAGMPGRIAINIKADGLARPIAQMVSDAGITEKVFVFDMSVPDMLAYHQTAVPAFTRYSEYEPQPSCLPQCRGVWVDAFEKPWADENAIQAFLSAGKDVAMVSPELHGKPHGGAWQSWRRALETMHSSTGIMVCTDLPDAARQYFCGDVA